MFADPGITLWWPGGIDMRRGEFTIAVARAIVRARARGRSPLDSCTAGTAGAVVTYSFPTARRIASTGGAAAGDDVCNANGGVASRVGGKQGARRSDLLHGP